MPHLHPDSPTNEKFNKVLRLTLRHAGAKLIKGGVGGSAVACCALPTAHFHLCTNNGRQPKREECKVHEGTLLPGG